MSWPVAQNEVDDSDLPPRSLSDAVQTDSDTVFHGILNSASF
jgi:hypothetical protein